MYLYVRSDKTKLYPENTYSAFKVQLGEDLHFPGNWEIGVKEISASSNISQKEVVVISNLCSANYYIKGIPVKALACYFFKKNNIYLENPTYVPLVNKHLREVDIILLNHKLEPLNIPGKTIWIALLLHLRPCSQPSLTPRFGENL